MWRLRPRTKSRSAKLCRASRASGSRSKTARVDEGVHCGPAKAGEAGLRADPRQRGTSGGVGSCGGRGRRGPQNYRGGGGVACGTAGGKGGEVPASGSPCLGKGRGLYGGARGLRTGEGLFGRGGGGGAGEKTVTGVGPGLRGGTRNLGKGGHGGRGRGAWSARRLSSIWRQGRPVVAWRLRARESG